MENYYRLQSLYEASYLLVKGFPLIGKEQAGSKITLIFMDSKELRQEVLKFYNGGGIIEAKDIFDSYRSLKDYVFQR